MIERTDCMNKCQVRTFKGHSSTFCRRQWHPTPVLLAGKSHRRRSLVGYSPWGCKEMDTTERLHFHFSLSCIEEGNGNPLQQSSLENPRDRGAWWAAILWGLREWDTTEATQQQQHQLSVKLDILLKVMVISSSLIQEGNHYNFILQ